MSAREFLRLQFFFISASSFWNTFEGASERINQNSALQCNTPLKFSAFKIHVKIMECYWEILCEYYWTISGIIEKIPNVPYLCGTLRQNIGRHSHGETIAWYFALDIYRAVESNHDITEWKSQDASYTVRHGFWLAYCRIYLGTVAIAAYFL